MDPVLKTKSGRRGLFCHTATETREVQNSAAQALVPARMRTRERGEESGEKCVVD